MSPWIQVLAGAVITVSLVLVAIYVIAPLFSPRIGRWVGTVLGGLSVIPAAVWYWTGGGDRDMVLVGGLIGSLLAIFIPAGKRRTQVQ